MAATLTPYTEMHINFIAQPQQQLGTLLHAALEATDIPTRVVFVSAFASLQAVLRLKKQFHSLHFGGTVVRLVVGVDMGGTSKEVLTELATWPIEVFVFKNKKGGVTFHPKLYIVEAAGTAEVFLGSNNLTDGGLYGNYEGAVRVSYELPTDVTELEKAKEQLNKFINPTAPVGRRLDSAYLEVLMQRRDIPDEAESRKRRKAARGSAGSGGAEVEAFGFESTPGAPALPMEVKAVVIAAVQHQLDELATKKKAAKKKLKAQTTSTEAGTSGAPGTQVTDADQEFDIRDFTPLAQISPTAFYLELTTTDGKADNIPGEQRIPLEAMHAAHDFWGWPDNYTESVNPRKGLAAGGKRRVYFSWKPLWRVHSVGDVTKDVTTGVRMYYVEANSDFRFHSGYLAKWAQAGDFVRIVPVEGQPYAYVCTLAVAGTSEHMAWKKVCGPTSGKSPRMFGYT